ncbi:MAG: hypothetical protein EBS05_07695 [Proteobacteria bacterium]|nr:hypothetical protein [Pseudomonadota bacterium]
MKLTLPVIALLALTFAALAANPPGVDSLTAKGVRFKFEKDGTISEASVGSKAIISVEDFQVIGAFHTLKRADISPESARLNDDTAKSLSHLDQLEKFFANGAELSDDGFKAFAGWKSLKSFGLDHWGWYAPGHLPQKGALGPGLAHLASCSNLEHVRLGGCRVDNRVTTALAQIKSLQSVDLQHTYAVTDEGIAALQALPKLRVIKLSPQFSPRITDATLVSLEGIKTLEEIELNETWLTYDKGFAHLKSLPVLKKVVLTKVVASDEDIARFKADHPATEVQWTKPDEATTTKTKEQFQRFWEKQSKAKP